MLLIGNYYFSYPGDASVAFVERDSKMIQVGWGRRGRPLTDVFFKIIDIAKVQIMNTSINWRGHQMTTCVDMEWPSPGKINLE